MQAVDLQSVVMQKYNIFYNHDKTGIKKTTGDITSAVAHREDFYKMFIGTAKVSLFYLYSILLP